MGGAVVKGFGLASAASVSSFVAVSTPYFVGISIVMMLAWAFWLFRRMGFDVKLFARTIVRHGTVMGVIYGVTLAATMGLAAAVGI